MSRLACPRRCICQGQANRPPALSWGPPCRGVAATGYYAVGQRGCSACGASCYRDGSPFALSELTINPEKAAGAAAAFLRSRTLVAERQERCYSRGVKIHLYFFGKPRDPHANAMAEDYVRRVSHYAKAEMSEIRPSRADPRAKHPSAFVVCLDPGGKRLDSSAFTALVESGSQCA